MAPTNDYLNSIPTKTISKPIVQLRPVVNEKPAFPEHIRQSLKYWKAELDGWKQESVCLSKMLKWNEPYTYSVRGKLICNRFEKLTKRDLPLFIETINEIEKEIFHSFMGNEHKIKKPLLRFQKLEKELKAFKTKIDPIKLEILKQVSKKSPITFF